MKRALTISAAALAAAFALAGCGASPGTSENTGMAGMGRGSSSASVTAANTSSDHNAADALFVQAMIPHHNQEVSMSGTVLKKHNIDARVTALARTSKPPKPRRSSRCPAG